MPSLHIKRRARHFASYLPSRSKIDSETAEAASDNDLDMSLELVSIPDDSDDCHTIFVEDREDEVWLESDWSSDGTSDTTSETSVENRLDADWDMSAFDNAPAVDDIPELLIAAVNDPELAHIAGLFPHWSEHEVRGFRRLSETIRRLLINLGLADYRPGDQSKALWWSCHMEEMDVRALTAHISEVMAAVAPKWQPTEEERQGQGRKDFVL